METIKKSFEIILRGDKEDSRCAARAVRKALYHGKARDKFEDIKNQIIAAPDVYNKISEDWRRENFAVAISVIYYLHDLEKQPDFLFPWLFELLQDKNGNIRQAAVRMLSNEIGPLTTHIRCPDLKSGLANRCTPQQADIILLSLFISLHNMLNYFWNVKYTKYKYISDLPSCNYKSTQLVLARAEDLCGDEYVNRLDFMTNIIELENRNQKND